MEKEKFMQFISKVYDLDASIGISFYGRQFSEETAKELAEEFAQIVDGKVSEGVSNDYRMRWFKVYNKHDISIFHKNSEDNKQLFELAKRFTVRNSGYMEEDVKLDGGDDRESA